MSWPIEETGLPSAIAKVADQSGSYLAEVHEPHTIDFTLAYLRGINVAYKKGIGLIVCGGTGSGKTVYGSLVFCKLMESGLAGIFCTEWTMRDRLISHEMWNEDQTFKERALEVSVLFLDRFFPMKDNKSTGVIFDFLMERELYRKINIITVQGPWSNLRAEEASLFNSLGIQVDLGSKQDLRAKRNREMIGWIRNGA